MVLRGKCFLHVNCNHLNQSMVCFCKFHKHGHYDLYKPSFGRGLNMSHYVQNHSTLLQRLHENLGLDRSNTDLKNDLKFKHVKDSFAYCQAMPQHKIFCISLCITKNCSSFSLKKEMVFPNAYCATYL